MAIFHNFFRLFHTKFFINGIALSFATKFTNFSIRSLNLSFGYCEPRFVLFKKSTYSAAVNLSSLISISKLSHLLLRFASSRSGLSPYQLSFSTYTRHAARLRFASSRSGLSPYQSAKMRLPACKHAVGAFLHLGMARSFMNTVPYTGRSRLRVLP